MSLLWFDHTKKGLISPSKEGEDKKIILPLLKFYGPKPSTSAAATKDGAHIVATNTPAIMITRKARSRFR
jgi:hypothetical protein